jgi:hypothetical protein
MEHQTGTVCKWEKLGVPSVAVYGSSHIKDQHEALCIQNKVPEARAVFREAGQTNADLIPAVVEALTAPLTDIEMSSDWYSPPRHPRIAFTGTLDEVQDFYVGDLTKFEAIPPYSEMTDGLPIVPPTEEKVAAMLEYTAADPEMIMGIMRGAEWVFDVEKVAINGVMAGCKPEHMPILLAMAEALQNRANTQAYFTYTGFGWMGVVSGPIAEEIDMNSELNKLNPGNPANACLGRALTLMKLNLAGWEPYVRMNSYIGHPANYSCVFAESDEGLEWPNLAEEHGVPEGQSGFTLFHGMKFMDSMASYGGGAANPKMYPPPFTAMRPQSLEEEWALAMLSVSHPAAFTIFVDKGKANRLANNGMSKDAYRQMLWEMAAFTNEWGIYNIPWYHHMVGQYCAMAAGYDHWQTAPLDAVFHLPPDPRDINFIIGPGHNTIMKATHISTVSIDKWGTGQVAADYLAERAVKDAFDAQAQIGTKLVLPALADTQIQDDSPDTNHGSAEQMLCDTAPRAESRAMIRFDLSEIPAEATIHSATLRLGPHLQEGEAWYIGWIDVSTSKVEKDWLEGEATWNQYADSELWESPGGDFADAPTLVVRLEAPTFGERAAGVWVVEFYGPEITADVIEWLENPGTNYGWLLQVYDREKELQIVSFDTKEHAPTADMFLPELVIYYE